MVWIQYAVCMDRIVFRRRRGDDGNDDIEMAVYKHWGYRVDLAGSVGIGSSLSHQFRWIN